MTTKPGIIPSLGMGTFRLKDEVAYESVKIALEVGFRHIDTAQIYGNEEAVGRAIKDSGIPRQEIFLTTKVWNDKLNKDAFLPSVKESLSKLQTDYVDLLLIHWPSPENGEPMAEYLNQLSDAKGQGLTHDIGVSNFTIAHIDEALAILPGDKILTNQVEVHPYLQNQKLRAHCEKKGITVTGYMPFAVGKVLKDAIIEKIAKKHNVSTAEVVLAWQLAHQLVTIPMSTKRDHLKTNFQAQQLTLDSEDITAIDELDRNDRQATPDFAPEWDV